MSKRGDADPSKWESFGIVCAFLLVVYFLDMVPDKVKEIGWAVFLLCFVGAYVALGISNLIEKKKVKKVDGHEETSSDV